MLGKLRDAKVYRITRHMVKTVDLLPKFGSKGSRNNPDSRVRMTGFCFIYATWEKFNHLLSLRLFIWRKWEKTIRLVV